MSINADFLRALLNAADNEAHDSMLQIFLSVQGDVITVGSISNSQGVAIGRHAQADLCAPASEAQHVSHSRAAPHGVRIYTNRPDAMDGIVYQLARRLELRGLTVIPSLIDRRLAIPVLIDELLQSQAIVLMIGPDVMPDGDMSHIVLPALRQAHQHDPTLPIYAVLDQIPEHSLDFRIQDFAMRPLLYKATQDQLLDTLAATVTQTVMLPALRGHKQARLAVAAHPEAGAPQGDVTIDMRLWYQQGNPAPDIWDTWLTPAILDSKHIFDAAKISDITLRAQARLSVALLVGYIYRESTHMFLRTEQRMYSADGVTTAIWSIGAVPSSEAVLHETTSESGAGLAATATAMTIEISSVKQPIQSHVDRWLRANPGKIRQRRVFQLLDDRLNEAQTLAAAQQIARAMLALKRENEPPQALHLFSSASFSLMAMLGWHLNTTLPIQTYELSADGLSYQPSVHIH